MIEIALFLILGILVSINWGMPKPQVFVPPYPMGPMNPPQIYPVGVPVPVGVLIPMPEVTTEPTTTTTTTCKPDAGLQGGFKIIIPWPHIDNYPKMPFSNENFTLSFPPMLPPPPPPPPPFPLPMGFPMPPPPVIMIPLPPIQMPPKGNNYPKSSQSSSSSSKEDSDDSSESDFTSDSESDSDSRSRRKYGIFKSHLRTSKHGKKRRKKKGARRAMTLRNKDVKPMLQYMAADGDVKIVQQLSWKEATGLLKNNDSVKSVKIVSGNDPVVKSKLFVVAEPKIYKRTEVVVKEKPLDASKNETKIFNFKPSGTNKFSNLEVSFNVEN